MRPYLVFVLVLALMVGTAVTGSAAAITNTPARLGSTTATVPLCDNSFNYTHQRANDPVLGGAKAVTNVTVKLISQPACSGRTLRVVLLDAANQVLGVQQSVVLAAADTSKTLDFSAQHIPDANLVSILAVAVMP